MGLLDTMSAPQAQQMPAQGGLLGGMGGMGAQAPQGGDGIAMLKSLMQSPTPEMAKDVASKFAAKGTPDALKISQMFMEAAGNPGALQKMSATMLAHVQGEA